MTISSWLNFGLPRPREGEIFGSALLQPARSVCVSLGTFSFVIICITDCIYLKTVLHILKSSMQCATETTSLLAYYQHAEIAPTTGVILWLDNAGCLSPRTQAEARSPKGESYFVPLYLELPFAGTAILSPTAFMADRRFRLRVISNRENHGIFQHSLVQPLRRQQKTKYDKRCTWRHNMPPPPAS